MDTYLKKGPDGIKTILSIIDKLRQKNLNYFRNTFKYFLTEHPPISNSSIFYNVEKNEYRFISDNLIKRKRAILFKDYLSGSKDDFIKEANFYYDVVKPHNVIIAQANWILKLLEDTNIHNLRESIDWAANFFYNDWYRKAALQEERKFKSLLDPKSSDIIDLYIGAKKLF